MARHNVTFEPGGVTVGADPALYPYGRHGRAGSILDIALANGLNIEHACGGAGACGTCHVIVEKGMENLSVAADEELDVVERVVGSTPDSRLACQAVVGGDVTVRIPAGNRNTSASGARSQAEGSHADAQMD